MKVSLQSECLRAVVLVDAAPELTAELLASIHLFPALNSVSGLYGPAITERDRTDARSMSRPRLVRLGLQSGCWEWDVLDQYFDLSQLAEFSALSTGFGLGSTNELLRRLPDSLTVLKLDGFSLKAIDAVVPRFLRSASARLHTLWLHPKDDTPSRDRAKREMPRTSTRQIVELVPNLRELSVSSADLLALFGPPAAAAADAPAAAHSGAPSSTQTTLRHLRTLRLGESPTRTSFSCYIASKPSSWSPTSAPPGQPCLDDLVGQLQTLQTAPGVLPNLTDLTLWDQLARGRARSDGWASQQQLDAMGVRLTDRKGDRWLDDPLPPPRPPSPRRLPFAAIVQMSMASAANHGINIGAAFPPDHPSHPDHPGFAAYIAQLDIDYPVQPSDDEGDDEDGDDDDEEAPAAAPAPSTAP